MGELFTVAVGRFITPLLTNKVEIKIVTNG